MRTLLFSIGATAAVSLLVLWVEVSERPTRERPDTSIPSAPVSRRYEELIAFWSRQLAKQPYSAIARRKIAEAKVGIARATGNELLYREAEALLKEAQRFAPQNDLAIPALLATTQMARHGFSEAYELVNGLLQEHPNVVWLRTVRGDAALALGRYEEALADFNESVNQDPGYSAWVRMAHVLDILGKQKNALAFLKKARDSYRGSAVEPAAWVRLRIGIHYLKMGRLNRAEQAFRDALAVAPDYFLAQEHLAEVFEIRGEYAKARPLLQQAISTSRSPDLLERLAFIESQLGHLDDATRLRAAAREELQTRASRNPVAHLREFAEYLMDYQEDLPKALEFALNDLRIRPGDLTAHAVAARAYRLNGNLEKAREHISEALRLDTPEADFYLEAVCIYWALDNDKVAERHLRAARALNPYALTSLRGSDSCVQRLQQQAAQ